MEEFKESSRLFEEDIYEVLEPETAVERRNSAGGTGFEQIKIAIEKAKNCLNSSINKNPVCSNLMNSRFFIHRSILFLFFKYFFIRTDNQYIAFCIASNMFGNASN